MDVKQTIDGSDKSKINKNVKDKNDQSTGNSETETSKMDQVRK